MNFLADLLTTVFDRRYRSLFGSANDSRTIEECCDDLLNTRGEASIQQLVHGIFEAYNNFDEDAKASFFQHLGNGLDINPDTVRKTLDAYQRTPSKQTYTNYMKSAEPPRQELFRRLNHVPGSTGQLVRMRADLQKMKSKNPALEAVDMDLKHLFTNWFNRGFLVLRRISWESPAHILEKIIQYEAVHAIECWDDLRRRLQPTDRRCFAFFHPAMPDEPLIFVEVALTHGVASSVQAVLAEDRSPMQADDADTAVFYSISNCQRGLAGISFGNSLIKQVASNLAAELEGLKTFVTLSPIPGLNTWLETEKMALPESPQKRKSVAAHYLMNAKARNNLPYDPVARFHLGNGAIVHAIHADADISKKGMAQSGGVMVNYLYDLKKVEENMKLHEQKQQVVTSSEVKSMANLFSAEALEG